MEVKIQCACGTRFAFEVEPVNGQMPTVVACPRCGTDQTTQANQQIQRQAPAVTSVPPPLPTVSPVAAPILPSGRKGLRILNIPGYDGVPVAAPPMAAMPSDPSQAQVLPGIPIYDDAPVASGIHMDVTGADIEPPKTVPLHIGGSEPTPSSLPESFPPPPESPPSEVSPAAASGGGLKVSRTKKAAPAPPPPLPVESASATVEESAAPRRNTPLAALSGDAGSTGSSGGWLSKFKGHGKGAIGGVVAVVVIGFKLLIKTKFLVKIIAVLFGAAVGSNSSKLDADELNFEYPNMTQVYVKAEDPKQVLDLCSNYWKHEGKELQVSEGEMGQLDQTHFAMSPAHQGYVAILGTLDWSTNFVDGLSKELSGKLGSTVLTFKESDFSGAHHFAVYQSGQRNFVHDYDQHIVNNDVKEEYKVEGESWVQDNGYFKPGKKGFEEFNFDHINLISKKLGLHWWDFQDKTNGFYRLQE